MLALCSVLAPLVAGAQAVPAVSFRTVADVQFDMWPADFNRDGITDFVGLGSSSRLQVWIGNGDGTFGAPIVSTAPVVPRATGDVNGDGRADVIGHLLFAETRRVDLVVLPGLGNGTLGEPISISPAGSQLQFVVIADFNGDRRPDLLGGYGDDRREVVIWPGHGDFTFATEVLVPSGGEGPRAAFVADVNSDGLRDVAVAHEYFGVWILTNTGNFAFTVSSVPSGSGRTTDVTARDVNGDGAVDLLISGRSTTFFEPLWTYGYVFVALGDGRATFTTGGEYPSGRGANSIVAGDFTRDGIVDVATLNHSHWLTQSTNCFGNLFQNANSVSLLEGHGDGTFGLRTAFAVESQRGDLTQSYAPLRLDTLNTSDVNRDRFPDLLVGEGKILLPIPARENRPPTAFAGDDYRTANSVQMLLNGTATDPDGHFLEFQWTGGAGGTLLEGNQPLACYQEPTVPGQHVFTLTASDGHGGIDSDDLAVYLVRPPTVTILSPAAGQVVPAGQPYTIRWTATSEDPLAGFFVSLRDASGAFVAVEGCKNLPPTARECTWTNTGAPATDAQILIEAFDVSQQFGTASSGPFVIGGSSSLPTGWQSRDIGAVAAAGSVTVDPGSPAFPSSTFTVRGSGADIWGTRDEFHYVYRNVSGDFGVLVDFRGVDNVDQWTKAGLMIRSGTDPGAAHVSLFVTPTAVKGVSLQARLQNGGSSVELARVPVPPPASLRLSRQGSIVRAEWIAADGGAWNELPPVRITLPSDVQIGFAVSSHSDGKIAAATFFGFEIGTSIGPPERWGSRDIGAVGAEGSATVSGSTVTVTGSGADIWGTADEFRFISQTYAQGPEDDFEFTARVTSVQHVNEWTKAGLMIRTHLGASAAHASVFVTPSRTKGVAFQRRRSEGAQSVHTSGPRLTVPLWLKLINRDGNVRSYYRTETGPWTFIGEDNVQLLGATLEVGLAVSSHVDGVRATATFDNVSIRPLRSVGTLTSIGRSDACGSLDDDGVTTAFEGKGTDIWGTADEFCFFEQPWTGDGTVTVRVSSVGKTHQWAKAGVMFRESLDPGSRHVMTIVSPERGLAMQFRNASAGTSAQVGIRSGGAPQWVRLVRSGHTFTGYTSEDGTTWLTLGTIAVPMNTSLFVGLAVTSHDAAAATTGEFDNVSLQP
jgi:regulation of enolase protein 1 (concanavalin A-like superfamily)